MKEMGWVLEITVFKDCGLEATKNENQIWAKFSDYQKANVLHKKIKCP